MNAYTHISLSLHIYIYIYLLSLSLSLYIYIYIYTYTHIHNQYLLELAAEDRYDRHEVLPINLHIIYK